VRFPGWRDSGLIPYKTRAGRETGVP